MTTDTRILRQQQRPGRWKKSCRETAAPRRRSRENRTDRYQDRRLLALFFDMTSMPPADVARVNPPSSFWNRNSRVDLVSIMTFANKLKVVESSPTIASASSPRCANDAG
jgi:hypothetical protein